MDNLAGLWCPVAWPNTSSDVDVKVLMDGISIYSKLIWSKADYLP